MTKLFAYVSLLIALASPAIQAQEATKRGTPAPVARSTPAAAARTTPAPARNTPEAAPAATAAPATSDPLKSMFGGGKSNEPTGPITTEVYSDEAFFDSAKYIGTFSGRVIVKDPRFNIQADKLTVYLSRGETRGLEKAVAEGNVGVIREQPGENGGPPSRAVGRADTATYTAADGNVELRGTPRLQSGVNTHIATSPDTVMVINQNGQLTTKGPSRTELRQEAKPAEPPRP
jgi:lipopolysaccharide transport protein LptA